MFGGINSFWVSIWDSYLEFKPICKGPASGHRSPVRGFPPNDPGLVRWFSTSGGFAPLPGQPACLQTRLVVTTEFGGLLASGGWRPGAPVPVLGCTAQPLVWAKPEGSSGQREVPGSLRAPPLPPHSHVPGLKDLKSRWGSGR